MPTNNHPLIRAQAEALAERYKMIELKSGDFVRFNNEVFWVCQCANQPLNYLRQPSCVWCDMLRPTQRAVDETTCACKDEAFINDETPGRCGNCGKPFRR